MRFENFQHGATMDRNRGQGPTGPQPGDEALSVLFSMRPVPDPKASAESGTPRFTEAEYVSIRTPGSRDVMERRVTDKDRGRFPVQYARFKAGHSRDAIDGTPLDEWPQINMAQRAELKANNVFTVEQIATMPDGNVERLGMGARKLRDMAKAWLAAAKDSAAAVKLAEQLSERDTRIADLQRQVADLAARLPATPEQSSPTPPKAQRRGEEGIAA